MTFFSFKTDFFRIVHDGCCDTAESKKQDKYWLKEEIKISDACQLTWRRCWNQNTTLGKPISYQIKSVFVTWESIFSSSLKSTERPIHRKQVGLKFGTENHQKLTFWPFITRGRCMFWISIASFWISVPMDEITYRWTRSLLDLARYWECLLEYISYCIHQDGGCGQVWPVLRRAVWRTSHGLFRRHVSKVAGFWKDFSFFC